VYGDTLVMRRRVAQLREQAEDVRQLAEALVARSDDVEWHGRAAESMHSRIRQRAAGLREAAEAHDAAASSLERHVATCDRLSDAIAGTERRVTALIADARARMARAEARAGHDDLHVLPTPEDRALVAFIPPPSGHRDWLDVHVPGL